MAWTAYEGKVARDDLVTARAGVERLTVAISKGQPDQARAALADIQDATRSAADSTDGPAWAVGGMLPVVGDDVDAVRTLADVGDRVAREVLPGIVDASAALSPQQLQPQSGQISIDGLQQAAGPLAESNEALQHELAQVDALRPDEMVDQIAVPVRELQDALAHAGSVTDRATTAAALLPTMLGGEGERTYLLLFQTNAEVRATGGIPGALAVITADDGQVRLQRQGIAKDFGGSYVEPVVPLSADELAIFSDKIGRYAADITFSPDFPRVAEVARAMWAESTGQQVDGVLATDPVALSYLLEGTGPIPVEGQDAQLTADNAAELLLNGVYLDRPNPDTQNEYFADAASSVFDAAIGGQGSPSVILDALVRAAGEQRLLVWSDDEREQQTLETTPLSGELAVEPADRPEIGIYLNDATGTKLDYYLDYDVTVEPLSCADGAQEQRVTIEMTSSVPGDLSGLNESILGLSRPAGWLLTNVYVYGPVDGSMGESTLDGEKLRYARLQHETRPIAGATIELKPGQSRTLVYDVVSGEDQTGDPRVSITPGVPGSGSVDEGGSAC